MPLCASRGARTTIHELNQLSATDCQPADTSEVSHELSACRYHAHAQPAPFAPRLRLFPHVCRSLVPFLIRQLSFLARMQSYSLRGSLAESRFWGTLNFDKKNVGWRRISLDRVTSHVLSLISFVLYVTPPAQIGLLGL